MRIKLIAISFTLTCIIFNAFGRTEINVLIKQIALSENEIEKGQLQYQLAKKYIAIDIDSAIYYGKEVVKLANKLESRKLRAKALYLLGYVYEQDRNVEQSIYYYSSSRLDYQHLKDTDTEEMLLENLVNLAHENSAFEIAEHYSEERIKLIPELSDHLKTADIYFGLGLVYQQNKQLEKAKLQFMRAKLEMDNHINSKDSAFYAQVILEMGITQMEIGNSLKGLKEDAKPYFDNALLYYDRVLRINPTMVNKAKVANNRGNLWLSQGKLDRAYQHFIEAKPLMKAIDSKRLLTVLYNNIGIVHFENNLLDSAHYYFKQSANANLSEKSIITNLKDISLSINFYLGDELTKSIEYLDQIRKTDSSLVSDFSDEAVAYYNDQIEKEKAFKKEQIKLIYEQGYAALKKEHALSEFIFSKKEQTYLVVISSVLIVFMLYLLIRQYKKHKIRQHNRKIISDMAEKLQ